MRKENGNHGHVVYGKGQRDSTSSASSTMEHAKRTNEHRTCVVAIVRMLGVPQMFVGRRLGGLSVFFTPAQARAWRKLGCSLVAASRIAKDFGSSATECVYVWLCAFLTVFRSMLFLLSLRKAKLEVTQFFSVVFLVKPTFAS